MKLDPKTIAEGWYDLHTSKLSKTERALGQWAEEALRDAIYHDGVYAFEIISAIHDLDEEQKSIEVFSAGPIEDMLAYQGAVVIKLVEAKARQDASFAHVLGGVWQNSMTDEIWDRIKKVRRTDSWADSRN
jgi:hypothetical protein